MNLKDILDHDKHKFRNRAVAILDGKPTDESLIQDAYQLGIDIERDHSLQVQQVLESQIAGLKTALESKNTTSVTVNAKQPTYLWAIVLVSLLYLVSLYLLLHV